MLPWAFLGVGVASLGYTVVNLLRYLALCRRGVLTRGRVISAVDADGEGVLKLVVELEDRAGRTHRIASHGASTTYGRKVGREVTVAYDPSRPERGRIAEDVRMQTMLGVVLALIFVGIGLAKLLG
jgi:hypothetical protein